MSPFYILENSLKIKYLKYIQLQVLGFISKVYDRLKIYGILSKITNDLLPSIDNILHICCVLANF